MRTKAFTLIELLIVIAIIAILALIAIPNFLEAQVRSKVARCQADMRSFATAVEAYAVDYNRCPLGQQELGDTGCISPIIGPDGKPGNALRNCYAQARLTTPIAYMTGILKDPFFMDKTTDAVGRQEYEYHGFLCKALGGQFLVCLNLGYFWSFSTRGPNPQHEAAGGAHVILSGNKGKNIIYDPTNGTMSEGVLIRTNKGVFDGVPGH